MFLPATCERSADAAAEQLDLSIARSRSELEEAFRLVYDSYLQSELTSPNATGMRLTPYHFLPTTEVMLVRSSGTSIATASLIVDGELGLPAESIYAREIDSLRNRGLRMAEVGCLADRRKSPARFIRMFRLLSTLIAQAAEFRGCNALIAATHPTHARFYTRQLGFRQIGELQACPYALGNPAVALLMDFEQLRGSAIHTHLFGKRFSYSELRPFEWDNVTREHFQAIYRQTQPNARPTKLTPVVGLPMGTVSHASIEIGSAW